MMGWGARRAAQSGAVAARAGGRSTSSRPQFSARLLRLGSIADSFQHAPEARGSAAGGGHHVAAAEKR